MQSLELYQIQKNSKTIDVKALLNKRALLPCQFSKVWIKLHLQISLFFLNKKWCWGGGGGGEVFKETYRSL